MAITTDKLIWSDRKRYFGLPLSFTKYAISEDRLFQTTGLLNLKFEEILLYRIRDLELKLTLGQRLFGVGSVMIHSSDKTMPTLELKNIKKPRQVKEMLYRQVEDCKDLRRMRTMEFVGDGHDCDHDSNGTDALDQDFTQD